MNSNFLNYSKLSEYSRSRKSYTTNTYHRSSRLVCMFGGRDGKYYDGNRRGDQSGPLICGDARV